MNKVNKKVINYTLITLTLTFLPIAINYFLNSTKKATIITILLVVVYFIFSKLLFNFEISAKFEIPEKFNQMKFPFSFLTLLIVTFLTQNVYLNFETIDWDTASYMVASNDINRGNLPNETQWESKGPVLFYLYSFLLSLVDGNLVSFKLLNDFLLVLISFTLFLIIYRKSNRNIGKSLSTSLLFVLLMSQPWALSEYSEIYSLLFIALAYLLLLNDEIDFFKYFLIGLFMSFSTLINQGTVLFIIPFLIISYINKKRDFLKFTIGFAIPHLIFLIIYILNDIFNIYFATYFQIPLGYSEATYANFYELRVFLRKFFEYNIFLYSLIIAIFIFYLSYSYTKKTKLKKILLDYDNWFITASFVFYFIASHNYYHHLIFLLFFISFLNIKISFASNINIVNILLGFSLITIIYSGISSSFYNLTNQKEVYDNYPLKNLSVEIDSYFEDDYTILALDYVLILHYLDKPNYSYIVHPSNHFEEFIVSVLEDLGRIDENHISSMLDSEPDVIICNPMMIIRGVATKIDDYNCAVDDYNKKYLKIDTEKYRMDQNLNYYYDPYKQINVYIKQNN
tara:strand:+ start:8998 stop:10701 length:1704 start_codon:yes stop_codon:yes gene_type:complete